MINESDDEFEDDEEIDDEEMENKIFAKQNEDNMEEDMELNPFREDDFSDDEEEKDEDYLQKIDDEYKGKFDIKLSSRITQYQL